MLVVGPAANTLHSPFVYDDIRTIIDNSNVRMSQLSVTEISKVLNVANSLWTYEFDGSLENVLSALEKSSVDKKVAIDGKNLQEVSRRLITKLMKMGTMIAVNSRVGPGQYAIVNTQLAAVLQDSEGFVAESVERLSEHDGSSLYKVGTVGGIEVYVWPYFRRDENVALVGRRVDKTLMAMSFFYNSKISGLTAVVNNNEKIPRPDARIDTVLQFKLYSAFNVTEKAPAFFAKAEFDIKDRNNTLSERGLKL